MTKVKLDYHKKELKPEKLMSEFRQNYLFEKSQNVKRATRIKAENTGKPVCTPFGIVNPTKLDISSLRKK